MHLAARTGHASKARQLLAVVQRGWSALHPAAQGGQSNAVEVFVNKCHIKVGG